MDKLFLLSAIDKYYLNGIIEKVKWKVEDNYATIELLALNKDMIGRVTVPNFEMKDCEIAIYNTSQLLKLIGITNSFVTLDIKEEHKIPVKLLIADNEFNLEYALADTFLVAKLPQVEEPDYDFGFNIDSEVINKFIKAKKALGTESFTIESINDENGDSILFTLGGETKDSNKVTFTIPIINMGEPIPSGKVAFNADYVKEIFDVNKDSITGSGYVSTQGLMKITFENEKDQRAEYILVAKG
jgi:hypothetical protein